MARMTYAEYEEFLRVRREAALKIDPANAEVHWRYREVFDPYGVGLDLPTNALIISPQYFARSPDSDIWVNFGELPDETADALREMHACSFSTELGSEVPVARAASLIDLAYAITQHSSKNELAEAVRELSPERLSDLKHKIATLQDWLDAGQTRSDAPET